MPAKKNPTKTPSDTSKKKRKSAPKTASVPTGTAENPPPGFKLNNSMSPKDLGVETMAWSTRGFTLAIALEGGKVYWTNPERADPFTAFEQHVGRVNCLAWSPNGETLASAGEDGNVVFLRIDEKQAPLRNIQHPQAIPSISWAPSGTMLATCCSDGVTRIWNLQKRTIDEQIGIKELHATCVSWSPDGSMLALGSKKGQLRIVDLSTSRDSRPRMQHYGYVSSLRWSPDGAILVSGSRDGSVLAWYRNAPNRDRVVHKQLSPVSSVGFSSDGKVLAVRIGDGRTRLWRTDTWNIVSELKSKATNGLGGELAFHPTKPRLATLDEKDTVLRIWELDVDTILGQSQTELPFEQSSSSSSIPWVDPAPGPTGASLPSIGGTPSPPDASLPPLSRSTDQALRFALQLAKPCAKTDDKIDSALLLAGLVLVGQTTGRRNTCRFLWSFLSNKKRTGGKSGDAFVRQKLLKGYGIESLPSEPGPAPSLSQMTQDAQQALTRALGVAETVLKPPKIHARHLLAALLMPGEPGEARPAQLALVNAQYRLNGMRSAFIDAQSRFDLEGGTQEAWRDILFGGESVTSSPVGGIAAIASDIDDVDAPRVDQLGIEREVNALCSVIGATDVHPPLSIGLFGDWGTGKSFFMDMMDARIKKIAARSQECFDAHSESRFCRDVVQIKFNAWHYVDANLWASLVTHIFDELVRQLSKPEDEDEVRKELLRHFELAKEQLRRAEEVKERASAAQERLDAKKDDVASRRDELDRLTPQQMSMDAIKSPEFEAIVDGVTKLLHLEAAPATSEELGELLKDGRRALRRVRRVWQLLPAASWLGKIGFLATLVAVMGLGWLLGGWLAENWVFLRGFGEYIGSGLALLAPYIAWARPHLAAFDTECSRLEKERRDAAQVTTARHLRKKSHLEEDLFHAQSAVVAAEKDLEAATLELNRADGETEQAKTGRQLREFILTRSSRSAYQQQLGIIAMIRRDFEGLSELLAKSKTGGTEGNLPRVDRIVLYIDDLDRCPADRVVEVLQAVHLLLAFKLFVVVVGVDPRWLLRALQEEYPAFATEEGDPTHRKAQWQTTPQNYLEKIFQIPYTLRRIDKEGFAKLVEKLVSDGRAVDAPSGGGMLPVLTEPAEGETSQDVKQKPTKSAQRATDEPDKIKEGDTLKTELVPPDSERTPDDRGDGETLGGGGGGGGQSVFQGGGDIETPGSSGGDADDSKTVDGESADESKIDMMPQNLEIKSWELKLMKKLDELIPSPRGAKRFVNLYRLIKATLTPEELESFEGSKTEPGACHAVLLMLAMQNGFANEAYDVFAALSARNAKEKWWAFVAELEPAATEGSDPPTYHNGVSESIRETDVARWKQLRSALEAQKKHFKPAETLAPFAEWAPRVARFSFGSGRTIVPSAPEESEASGETKS